MGPVGEWALDSGPTKPRPKDQLTSWVKESLTRISRIMQISSLQINLQNYIK